MLLRIVVLAAICAVFGSAEDDIISAAKDPGRLAEYINANRQIDFGALQKGLGVSDDGVFLPPCDEGDCRAELIAVSGVKPEESIVWVSHTSARFAFWLRYRKNGSGAWQFPGASAVNVKYFEPEHKLATVFGRPFFIVVEQGLAGAGISTMYETWFDLTLPRADPVFAFTREGDETIWPSALRHDVHAAASPLKRAGNEEIKLDLSMHFQREEQDSAGRPMKPCGATATAYYVRRGNGEFTLDPALSSVPEPVLKYVFDIQDTISASASNPQSPAAKWLSLFLQTCKDMPDKSEVLRLLH